MPHKRYIPNFFARLGLSCDHVPDYVYEQAQEIIKRLENGAHFQSVYGKKMLFDKSRVCIPVGRKYRLYARLQGNKIVITHLLTHENYNNLLKCRSRGETI